MDFAFPANYRGKSKKSKRQRSTRILPQSKNELRYIGLTVIPVVSGALGTVPRRKGIGGAANQRMNGDLVINRIVKISEKTERSPRDQRRLAVTKNINFNP